MDKKNQTSLAKKAQFECDFAYFVTFVCRVAYGVEAARVKSITRGA